MLCASIKDVKVALKAAHNKLVHVDVWSIKLQPAYTILHITLYQRSIPLPRGRWRHSGVEHPEDFLPQLHYGLGSLSLKSRLLPDYNLEILRLVVAPCLLVYRLNFSRLVV